MIATFLNSKQGSIIVSIILGLGLATLFRQVCKDDRCIIYKGPSAKDTDQYFYKMNDKCYKYTATVSPCTM